MVGVVIELLVVSRSGMPASLDPGYILDETHTPKSRESGSAWRERLPNEETAYRVWLITLCDLLGRLGWGDLTA